MARDSGLFFAEQPRRRRWPLFVLAAGLVLLIAALPRLAVLLPAGVQRVDAALATVGMSEYAHHEPHRLSGGQKQRVAIAGIIAMKPRCMIFDESTAMLDPLGRREVLATMEKLNREEGITVLSITHYMDEAARADRVIVLSDGQILLDGTPGEVFAHADTLRTAGLDVPQCTAAVQYLQARGVRIRGDLNTPEQCAAALLDAWRTRGGAGRTQAGK